MGNITVDFRESRFLYLELSVKNVGNPRILKVDIHMTVIHEETGREYGIVRLDDGVEC